MRINDRHYDSPSSLAFFSPGLSRGSSSALRFAVADSAGATFFFFLTTIVKSLTGASGGIMGTDLSSLSSSWAANAGAEVSTASVGDVFSSST